MWGRCERVIVTSGLSKAYGLPGLRIGWIVAPPALVASTVVVSRLRHHRARRAQRSAGAGRARRRSAGRSCSNARAASCARNLPLLEAWLARRRRRFAWIPAGGRRDLLRALRHPINSTALVDAAPRGEERADRARRSLRHGPLPAHRLRRTAGVRPRRPGAAARPARVPSEPRSQGRHARMTRARAVAGPDRLRPRRRGASCSCWRSWPTASTSTWRIVAICDAPPRQRSSTRTASTPAAPSRRSKPASRSIASTRNRASAAAST